MSNHNCPKPESRNREDDLKVLAVAVIRDRLGWSDELNEHVADTTDLLIGYVQKKLGTQVRVNWLALTDDELPAVKAWQDYCVNLYDSVKDFAVERILA